VVKKNQGTAYLQFLKVCHHKILIKRKIVALQFGNLEITTLTTALQLTSSITVVAYHVSLPLN
jgi:hypothetical protein